MHDWPDNGTYLCFWQKSGGVLGSDTIKITIGYGIAKINLLNWTKIKSVTVYIMACCVSGGIAILQSRLFPEQIESTILLYNSPLIIIASLERV